jgi:hypothetical protein
MMVRGWTATLASVLLIAGCATFVNLQADREAGKGATRTYAVSLDDAWRISRQVLRWEGAEVIQEDRDAGSMLTPFPQTHGGVAGIWVEPLAGGTKVTVILRGGMLYEGWLHMRFAQAVEMLNAGQPLTTTAPRAPRSH